MKGSNLLHALHSTVAGLEEEQTTQTASDSSEGIGMLSMVRRGRRGLC